MTDTIEVAACILGAGPVGATLAATLAAAGLRRLTGRPYVEPPERSARPDADVVALGWPFPSK